MNTRQLELYVPVPSNILINTDFSYSKVYFKSYYKSYVVCLRVQGKAVNTPVQNTKEITIKNGYVKIHSLCLEFFSKK